MRMRMSMGKGVNEAARLAVPLNAELLAQVMQSHVRHGVQLEYGDLSVDAT